MESEWLIFSNGTKEWRLNNQLHREDGPAVEWSDGVKEWYLNGQRHREDGPAIECLNDHKEWYLNDRLHREDGPAIENPNGYTTWWLNNQQLTEKQLLSETIKIDYPNLYNSYLIYQIMGS